MQQISVIPGRIRLKDRALLQNADLAGYLNVYTDNLAGVKYSAVNHNTASVLIVYDVKRTSAETIIKNIENAIALASGESENLLDYYKEYALVLKGKKKAKNRLIGYGLIYLLLKIKQSLFGKFLISASVPALQVAAVVTIIGGYPLLKHMYRKLTQKIPADADILLSLAAVSLTLLRESTKGVLLLALKALNDYIRSSADASCIRLLNQLRGQEADVAWLITGAKQQALVSAKALKPGETILVHAGEAIPVEGTVSGGRALVETLYYTGQPEYARMQKGAKVYEGMSVVSGELRVKVQKLPEEVNAPSIKTGGLLLDQKVSRYERLMTPVALAAGTLGMVVGGGFMRLLAVMLALTPSGARSAVSTGMKSYVSLLSRHQIFIRKTEALESIVDADYIVFDKTGTLTDSHLSLQSVLSFDSRYPQRELMRICAACESSHYHPIAISLSDPEKTEGAAKASVLIPSRGVRAEFEKHRIVIGSRAFMKESGVRLSPKVQAQYAQYEKMLYTPILVGIDGRPAGMIVLSESMREGALDTVRRLRCLNAGEVMLLTGDTQYKARRVAQELGIREYYSGCSSEEKEKVVAEYRSNGAVMMIGDGVNDVGAMRAASVSVSFVHSASDLTRKHSDIIVFDDRLPRLADMFSLSKKAHAIINQTIGISKVYNLAVGAMAFTGAIDAFSAKSLNTVNSLMVLLLNKRIEYLSPERHYYMPDRPETQGALQQQT